MRNSLAASRVSPDVDWPNRQQVFIYFWQAFMLSPSYESVKTSAGALRVHFARIKDADGKTSDARSIH
jgi:hypothetical protein